MSAHNDAAFLRMFLIILGALVGFTIIILIAANQIIGSAEEARGDDPRLRAMIAERIRPVGSVNVAGRPAPAVAAAKSEAPQSAADIVASACNACHLTGVLESPKTGDKDAWTQRLAASGIDGLVNSVILGKGAMPPKGGAMVSDEQIREAVEHMLAESGVDVAAAAVAPEKPATATAAAPGEPVVAEAPPAAEPAAQASAAPAADLAQGKSVYDTACFACHATGAAGAPLLSNATAWQPRLAQGMDALYANSINGKGTMPPKGGRVDLSDDAIRAAVDYMVAQVK